MSWKWGGRGRRDSADDSPPDGVARVKMVHVGQRESSGQEVRKQRQEDTWKDIVEAIKNDDRSMW